MLAITVVILAAAVWYRYVLNDSLGWSDEIGSFLLVWLTFLGAYPCFRKGLHLDFPLMLDYLSPAARRWVKRGMAFCLALFCAYVAWESWKVLNIIGPNRISSLNLPRGLFFAALPVSFALMTIALLAETWRLFTSKD